MRLTLLLIAVAAFIGLGAIDLAAANYHTGIASILLAAVNGLLLSA